MCIFLVGAMSFGPMMLSAWEQKQGDQRARREVQAQPSSSMRWVVDPAQPGKVKLARPSRDTTEATPDTVGAQH